MNCNAEHCQQWVGFLECHKNLNRLYIEESNLNDEIFLNLKDVANLKDISISLFRGNYFRAESIVEFVEERENLLKFSISSRSISNEPILREKLEHKWDISNDRNMICLERKII